MNLNREKYVIAKSVINAIQASASCYQSDGKEGEYSEEEFKEIGEYVKSQCSQMMIDDLITILTAYCLKPKKYDNFCPSTMDDENLPNKD